MLHILSDYPQAGLFRLSSTGRHSRPFLCRHSFHRALGTILLNLYVDDLLQLVKEVAAYTDYCTLSHFFRNQDSHEMAAHFSGKLSLIKKWGELLQVDFSPYKDPGDGCVPNPCCLL